MALEEKSVKAVAQVRAAVPAAKQAELAVFGDLADLLPPGQGMDEGDDTDGFGKDVNRSHFKGEHHELRSLPTTSGSLSDAAAERLAWQLTLDLKSRLSGVRAHARKYIYNAGV